ncbi:hypothetical protein SMSP2_02216 [Limihaloglobus sulfuriphilus]|uniref:AAA+ ATPase domain-containing protein n=1 Tax=Limihaloglobus sulfuriphilus TaxID=1851148 RepID=A0A1Q2MHR5_9BACT|nr:ATP-binding protein [Limihaloglobus sulfuriphilus]AQQ71837.1 hypothetical protein SMSP2_02216 [Limihaloglobus sulfuriphilus]
MINRHIQSDLENRLFSGKAIVLMGPRQVGKTTLIDMVCGSRKDVLYLNGDEPDIRENFSDITSDELIAIIGSNKIVVIDEAQRIKNIGLTLKLITDKIKHVQVIASGSSSFELASNIKEPLTGRKTEFKLYPLSYAEMVKHHGLIKERRLLEQRLIYGYYPEVVTAAGDDARNTVNELADSYLYKDLFILNDIKKSYVFEKLVQALALQIGSEVSPHELSRLIGVDKNTVNKYLDLLEKAFVVFSLPSLARNVRTELRKGRKYYFYDTGIRNAVINNFASLAQRADVGAIWENFLIAERRKLLDYKRIRHKMYFWRTTQQQEIDYVEERENRFHAFEFKWNPSAKARISKTFTRAYPDSETAAISRENYEDFFDVH